MPVFVNASTCVAGGGVQVASGFLNHLASFHHGVSKTWFFALSDQVVRECDTNFLDELRANGRLITTSASPGSPIGGYASRRALAHACHSSGCDRVFTVLGPSYVNFRLPEYMGFADAFAFSPTDEAYTWHPLIHRIFGRLSKAAKMFFASGAKRYWVESPYAKPVLARALGIPDDHVAVIPNCVNSRITGKLLPHQDPDIPTFFFLAAAYWHKNHLILPGALRELCVMRPGINLRVITTLPPASPILFKLAAEMERAGVSRMWLNVGPLRLDQVAEQLSRSTVVMQVSLLEVFSSTYLEAMESDAPLLVSDRAFARDVCGDAALYVNPHEPADIAGKMIKLIDDSNLRRQLASNGRVQLSKFPNAESKNEKLYEFCTQ